MAFTEPELFHRLLEKIAEPLLEKTQFAAENFPGHLWRIYGPEYATEPYLPPHMFKEYVQNYTGDMIDIIHQYQGIVRVHSHGKIKNVLKSIVEMGADAIDPIEPPDQGDVELEYMADEYGNDLVLFGNLEITDIMNLEPDEFEKTVEASVEAGKKADGFVLMPSASPYGRDVPERAIENYKTMIRAVKG
jgi:uroporphyrinogen-III decarboxylase